MGGVELHDPNITEHAFEQGYIYLENQGVVPVTYEVCGNLAILEGDIILGDLDTMQRMRDLVESYGGSANDTLANADMLEQACAISTAGAWWPKMKIPYEVSCTGSTEQVIKEAIRYVNKYTPITLHLHYSERDFVKFVPDSGCSSYVGRQGYRQMIRIASWAVMGNVVHEIFHAAGLWHEQSRSDRDNYVYVELNNLENPKYSNNFGIHKFDGINLGKYDYNSIMHYPEDAFAKAGTKTIIPIDPYARIGQRNGASQGDKLALVYMYAKS